MRVSFVSNEFLFIAHSLVNAVCIAVFFEVVPCMDTRREDHESGMDGGKRCGFSE